MAKLPNVARFGTTQASASTVTLPDDGDFLDISGTVTIGTINTGSKAVDAVFRLHFLAAATLTYDGTKMQLSGAASYTAVAGETLTMRVIGTNQVAEIAARSRLASNDAALMHLASTETATGAKTFSISPVVPTPSANDNSTKAASTAYVDAADALKAPLASPALTGNPTAPTQSAGNNSTRIATTAYTDGAVATAKVGAIKFKNSTDCSSNPNYPSALQGDLYIVSVAGKIGGASGTVVEVGDWYLASADNAGGTQASVGTSWSVVEKNDTGVMQKGTYDTDANGVVDLAAGGTGVDLSAAGGSGFVLKQNSSHVISAAALVAGDIPSLAASKITSGTFDIARLATGTPDGTKFVADDGTLKTPSGGGASAFTDLSDVPGSYSGQSGKVVAVNTGETALEFVAATGTGDMTKAVFDTGNDGKIDLSAGGTGVDLSGAGGSGYVLKQNSSHVISAAALVAGDIPNIAESQVTSLTSDLAAKAPLASPTFTGTPAAPTPSANDNSTKIATTAYADTADALAVHKSGPETITGPKLHTAQYNASLYVLTPSGTVAVDWDNGNCQSLSLGEDTTLTFTHPVAGARYAIELVQPASGGPFTPTLPTIKWIGGTEPTWSTGANAIDLIGLFYDGTNYLGSAGLGFA